MGTMLGISGLNHGFFEILQGNNPTESLIIQAIGPDQLMWEHGAEEAFTIVPNFLLTGILSVFVSLAIIFWSIGFLQKKSGSTVFLLLFILLFFVGGGIGQVLFFIPTWAFSTRINKPLTWWEKTLPANIRGIIGKLWPFSLSLLLLLFLIALEIAIFRYFPLIDNADAILYTAWYFLLAGWILLIFSFVSGFAYDLEHKQTVSDERI
jgi:hypothetical protein